MRKFYICLMSFILTITTILPVYAENAANDLVKQLQQSFAHVTETADLAHENTMKEEEPTEPVLVPYSDSIPIYMTQDEAEQIELEVAQLNNEIILLAQTIYNEARGLNRMHRAAIVWCVLNRVDAPGYGDTIYETITAPNQFALWEGTPIIDEHVWVARDVVTRWIMEKHGYINVGRVLPASYKFYAGDGKVNWFREEYNSTTYWNWAWGDIYGGA